MEAEFLEIQDWANRVFGPVSSVARLIARANEEMAEALRAATSDQPSEKVLEECADVVIVLARLPGLAEAIRRKRAVNDARIWKTDGSGQGYHVRDKTVE